MEATGQPSPRPCPMCGDTNVSVFFGTTGAPVFCNVLWASRQSALAAPLSNITLGLCHTCGLIYNTSFDPLLPKYTAAYENSLSFSPRFRRYAEELALRLVERYQLYNKDIVEIGCGQGDFLALMAAAGGNRGLGFDPSYDASDAATSLSASVSILAEAYSEQYASRPADFVCCRQVLEHIAEPLGFVQSVRRAVGDRAGTVVFFEVPNALYILRQFSVWDIIYEHCSYFTPLSLGELFLRAEFDPADIMEQYEGQFLTIEARARLLPNPATGLPEEPEAEVDRLCDDFRESYTTRIGLWRQILERGREEKARVVLWGAGSKGVTFLNSLHVPTDVIEYVVDINPRKHGRYVPGMGQQVVPPQILQTYRPHTVIIMNSIYRAEIEQTLFEMGLNANLLLAHEPAVNLMNAAMVDGSNTC